MLHIVIQHHNYIFLQGLRTLCNQAQDFEIVGEAEPRSLVELACTTEPDVVLVDGSRASSLELTSQLHDRGVRGIIVLVQRVDEEIFFEFFRRGAAAYVLTSVAPNALLEKIRRVAGGEYLMTDELFSAPALALAEQCDQEGTHLEAVQPKCVLSDRELEMVRFVARGMSNKMIAKELGISDQTIKNHMTSVLSKLHVSDRTSAVVTVLRRGYLSLDDTSFEEMAPHKHRQDGETLVAFEKIAS